MFEIMSSFTYTQQSSSNGTTHQNKTVMRNYKITFLQSHIYHTVFITITPV